MPPTIASAAVRRRKPISGRAVPGTPETEYDDMLARHRARVALAGGVPQQGQQAAVTPVSAPAPQPVALRQPVPQAAPQPAPRPVVIAQPPAQAPGRVGLSLYTPEQRAALVRQQADFMTERAVQDEAIAAASQRGDQQARANAVARTEAMLQDEPRRDAITANRINRAGQEANWNRQDVDDINRRMAIVNDVQAGRMRQLPNSTPGGVSGISGVDPGFRYAPISTRRPQPQIQGMDPAAARVASGLDAPEGQSRYATIDQKNTVSGGRFAGQTLGDVRRTREQETQPERDAIAARMDPMRKERQKYGATRKVGETFDAWKKRQTTESATAERKAVIDKAMADADPEVRRMGIAAALGTQAPAGTRAVSTGGTRTAATEKGPYDRIKAMVPAKYRPKSPADKPPLDDGDFIKAFESVAMLNEEGFSALPPGPARNAVLQKYMELVGWSDPG